MALLCAPLLLALAACGSSSLSLFGGDVVAQVVVDAGINQDSPVPVELVVVYDKKLLDQLLTLTARDWFTKKDQIKRDFPGDEAFVSIAWELVPGQVMPAQELSFGVGARAGIVYADYFSLGDHRARIDPHQNVVIHLRDSDFSVEQAP
jgi:type VI secretion system protein